MFRKLKPIPPSILKINSIHIGDIEDYYKTRLQPDREILDDLFKAGFLSFQHSSQTIGGGASAYLPNETGNLFLKYCYEEKIDKEFHGKGHGK